MSKNNCRPFETIWISTEGWISDKSAGQLLYSFFFSYAHGNSTINVPLTKFSPVTNTSILVPLILGGHESSPDLDPEQHQDLYVFVHVRDELGSQSRVGDTINIADVINSPPELLIDELAKLSSGQLEDAKYRRDHEVVFQMTSSILLSVVSIEKSNLFNTVENTWRLNQLKNDLIDTLQDTKNALPFIDSPVLELFLRQSCLLFYGSSNNTQLSESSINFMEDIMASVDSKNVQRNTGDLVLNSMELLLVSSTGLDASAPVNNIDSLLSVNNQSSLTMQAHRVAESIVTSMARISSLIASTYQCGEFVHSSGILFESIAAQPCRTNSTVMLASKLVNSTVTFNFYPSEFNITSLVSIFSKVNFHPSPLYSTRVSPVMRMEARNIDADVESLESNHTILTFDVDAHTVPVNHAPSPKLRVCMFFNTTSRKWSNDGCQTFFSTDRYACTCNHMTDFGFYDVDDESANSENESGNENRAPGGRSGLEPQVVAAIFSVVVGFVIIAIVGVLIRRRYGLKHKLTRVHSSLSSIGSETTEFWKEVALQDVRHMVQTNEHKQNGSRKQSTQSTSNLAAPVENRVIPIEEDLIVEDA
eukprot:TRINITY_DN9163_c0_g1_i2.p1 TRINITY_DN9163_c0_g1~~TRINITY_DN9163_c0_g1_i2.p1  ORF type:complete len:590 (-),score=93.32 TRINITY_DN9163_c0_g1_i2:172-1941(-)